MMAKLEIVNPIAPGASRFGAAPPELSAEDKSKDEFFVALAEITEAMIAKHGKDFAMGTLILSARFIAEDKPLVKRAAAPPAAAHVHDASCSHGPSHRK